MTVKKIALRSLLLAFVLAVMWRAQAQPLVLSSNRWLIVVDTSLSMDSCQQATLDSVQAMLLSGMNGQLRPGDTIGIWTFNETLTKGRFPLQLWHPEVTQTIASRAAQFLKTQKNEKSTRFECLVPDINRLVTNSDILTVILLTDGDTRINGTPFDATVNATFKKDFHTQKKAHAPFIVAFRSEGGKMTGITLTPAPWLATFPSLPPAPAPVVAQEEPAPAVAPMPEPAPAAVPSIIMSGNKSESTNDVAASAGPQPSITWKSGPIATLTPEPAIINTQDIATATVETQTVVITIVDTNVPPPENPTTQTAPQMPDVPTAPTVAVPPNPEPTPPEPVAEAPVKPLEAAAPAPSSSVEQPPAVVAAAKENIPPPSTPATKTPVAASPASVPVETGVLTPPNSGNQTRLLLGIGLLVIALGIGVFWMRKSRPPSSGSLITRSLDKDKDNSEA